MRERVLCFDLGGTWFRTGLLDEHDSLHLLSRVPALSVRNRPEDPVSLQRMMVDHIVSVTTEQSARHSTAAVAVSVGAALNAVSGEVLGSAPLWGPGRYPLRLAETLGQRLPGQRVTVVNDVTALAYSIDRAALSAAGVRRAAVVTVSSGIACRTIEVASGRVPVDPRYGLQGEIGHLPVQVRWQNRHLAARCDCGQYDHVSAFSAGPGIEALLARLPEAAVFRQRPGDRASVLEEFSSAVRAGTEQAAALLDLFTRPLATVLLYQSTLDPEVSATFLYGGVVDALGEAYLDSLVRNLHDLGLYGISDQDHEYFSRRTFICRDSLAALRGAGRNARHLAQYNGS